MSSDYTYEESIAWETCPKCGYIWEGECLKDFQWYQWNCGECEYAEGAFSLDGQREVLVEGDPTKQTDNPLNERKAP